MHILNIKYLKYLELKYLEPILRVVPNNWKTVDKQKSSQKYFNEKKSPNLQSLS